MSKQKLSYLFLFLFLLALLCSATGFIYFTGNRYHKEVKLSNEREIKVTLESGFGTLAVSRGKPSAIFDADIDADKNVDFSDCINYSMRERVGFLNINTNEDLGAKSEQRRHSFHISGLESSTWDMHFTDAVPISFDVELGLGKGEFDLTGLTVKDLTISAGASSFFLKFDQPNKGVIDELSIESGLSKFKGEKLCNANFNHFKFQGGVGSYSLDFGGKLDREVDVDIEVGLGSLTVTVPEDIGAKIIYEKNFIAHIDLDRDFSEQGENTYFSSNFEEANGKINMRIEAGLGSVKIRRER